MIFFYKTEEEKLYKTEKIESGTWVHLSDPTEEEVQHIVDALSLDKDFVSAALDEEERSRIETDDGQTLIIIDIPYVEPTGTSFVYNTVPMGIILTEDNIITVCLEESTIIEDFMNGRIRNFYTFKKTRFILQLLYRISAKYLQYLKQIDKATMLVESELHRSMKNKELIQMLRLEKSLVFFSTSLKSNEIVMEKLLRMDYIKKYPDDTDLLEDVIIENKQAIEMCNIYRDILSGTMDAFASVISNNLNIVMKLLASITIIFAVPQLVASLWGMNVKGIPFSTGAGGFYWVLGFSAVITVIAVIIMWKKKFF